MKAFHRLTVFFLITILGSCISLEELAPSVDETFMQQSGASSSEFPQLKKGRHLYTARCGSCHSLDKVDAFTYSEWIDIMDVEEMASKSKFSAKDTSDVLAYIKKAMVVAQTRSKTP